MKEDSKSFYAACNGWLRLIIPPAKPYAASCKEQEEGTVHRGIAVCQF
jgi:hypothetical protein